MVGVRTGVDKLKNKVDIEIFNKISNIGYTLDGRFVLKDDESEISRNDIIKLLSKIIAEYEDNEETKESTMFDLLETYHHIPQVLFSTQWEDDSIPPLGFVLACSDEKGSGDVADYQSFYNKGRDVDRGIQSITLEASVDELPCLTIEQILIDESYFEFKNLKLIDDPKAEPVDFIIKAGKNGKICDSGAFKIYKNGKMVSGIQSFKAWVGTVPDKNTNVTVRVDLNLIKNGEYNSDIDKMVSTYIETYVGSKADYLPDGVMVKKSFSMSDDDFMIVVIDHLIDSNIIDEEQVVSNLEQILAHPVDKAVVASLLEAAKKDSNRTQILSD